MLRLFALSLILTATVCLAADKNHPYVPNDDSSSEDDSQLSLAMKKHPEQLPSLLVLKGWEVDEAKAFALGLAMGDHCEKQECNVLKYVNVDGYGDDMLVVMKNFRSAIFANLEWKDGEVKYNPFVEFFNLKEIQNSKDYNGDEAGYPTVRSLFARHAKSATAMVVIDVAFLKWVVHAIKTKPELVQFLTIETDMILFICALSINPLMQQYCIDDILTVLHNVQLYTIEHWQISVYTEEEYISSLVTLFKLLDDGPIRDEVERIISLLRPNTAWDFINARMLLGADHPLIETFEKYFAFFP